MKKLLLLSAALVATAVFADEAKPVAVPGAANAAKALKAAMKGASNVQQVKTDDGSRLSDADKQAYIDARREKEEAKKDAKKKTP